MITLIIIRGIPGSGKSTFAKTFDLPIFEADQYFMKFDERLQKFFYKFRAADLKVAHDGCFKNVRNCLTSGVSCVVCNTFCKKWEMERYLQLGYDTIIYRCMGDYGSVHGVPDGVITRMKQSFEDFKNEIKIY